MSPLKVSRYVVATCLSVTVGFALAQEPVNFEKQFARLDADGDGKMIWSEAYFVRVKEFADMDRNQDGIVDKSEYGSRRVPFSRFDADSSGTLELSEYVGQHCSRFRMADANRDGNLSLQEYTRAQQAMHDQ